MLDEFPLLLNYDNLTQQLLQIPGVPNTTYRVDGGRVFVFAALEQQVEEMLIANPSAAISEVALLALPSAWVCARDAVEQFNIMPVPYKRNEIEGRLAIVHEPFNAVLPPRFDTEGDRDAALAQLLSGEVLAGSGEFEFRGQPMTLLEPLDLNSLPPAPKVNIAESEIKVSTDHTCLRNVDYIPGFALLDFQTFAAIRTTEITWASTNAYVVEQVYKKATLVWEIAQTNLNWQSYSSYEDDIPSYEIEKSRELREIYPELATLSNEALYWLFDSYQSDCCGLRCWEPYRENCFLFYLLGLAATEIQANDEKVHKIGEFVGYKSLDVGLSEALKQGQIWFNYDVAIESLIWRTFVVMNFLCRAKEPNQGEPVVTLSNIFVNGGRKVDFSTSK